jgi:hypothetical protein
VNPFAAFLCEKFLFKSEASQNYSEFRLSATIYVETRTK